MCSRFAPAAPARASPLSLHDALPISARPRRAELRAAAVLLGAALRARDRAPDADGGERPTAASDRKSTRLNSSHEAISYAVVCLKKTRISYPLARPEKERP